MDTVDPPEDQEAPVAADLQTYSLSSTDDPLFNQFGTLNDLCYEISSLQDLASRGSWRSILDKVARARKLFLLSKPHEHLTYLSYNVLALTKLRRYADAAAEFDSLENDLDSSSYHYQSYPQHYPNNRYGSMVPFALRWLHAELPSKLGKRPETLDRLYTLLDFVRTKLSDESSNKSTVSAELWRKREGFVMNSIISHHLSHKEFGVCLNLINDLISHSADIKNLNPVLLSKLGYIQMQVGDLEGAKATFDKIEGLVPSESRSVPTSTPETNRPALMGGFIGAVVKLAKVAMAIYAALLVSLLVSEAMGMEGFTCTALTIFVAVKVYQELANCFTDPGTSSICQNRSLLSFQPDPLPVKDPCRSGTPVDQTPLPDRPTRQPEHSTGRLTRTSRDPRLQIHHRPLTEGTITPMMHATVAQKSLQSTLVYKEDFTTFIEDARKTTIKILSYNVWFRKDVKLHERMKALGDLIQLHSPDVICFQEVTSDIYHIFEQSNWWSSYHCSGLYGRTPSSSFCIQLSKLPVNSFSIIPFSTTGRKICIADIEVGGGEGKPLVVATTHLQVFSKERVAQAKEALNLLKNSRNVIFCGDLNWVEQLDGEFPLFPGWVDAWSELRPKENGWTYDTKSNPMLSANYPLQKRLDRFICNLPDFRLKKIDMIGTEAIPGLLHWRLKCVRKQVHIFLLPVLPSDHYGLLLEVQSR